MKRHLLAVASAAVALATGTTLAAAPSASAAPAARAAIAPIRTYADSYSWDLIGSGDAVGWYYRSHLKSHVIFSPHYAIYETYGQAYFVKGKPKRETGTWYVVGGRSYVKQNGAKNWTVKNVSAKQLKTYAHDTNPVITIQKFRAIPGVKLVGTKHYSVTATAAKIDAFIRYEYGNTAKDLTQNGIKTATINVWVDSAGRPVKVTIAGKSADVRLSVSETMTHYNAPQHIIAP